MVVDYYDNQCAMVVVYGGDETNTVDGGESTTARVSYNDGACGYVVIVMMAARL